MIMVAGLTSGMYATQQGMQAAGPWGKALIVVVLIAFFAWVIRDARKFTRGF